MAIEESADVDQNQNQNLTEFEVLELWKVDDEENI